MIPLPKGSLYSKPSFSPHKRSMVTKRNVFSGSWLIFCSERGLRDWVISMPPRPPLPNHQNESMQDFYLNYLNHGVTTKSKELMIYYSLRHYFPYRQYLFYTNTFLTVNFLGKHPGTPVISESDCPMRVLGKVLHFRRVKSIQ